MEWAKLFIELLKVFVSWQFLIFILILVIFIKYRDSLVYLLEGISELKGGGFHATFALKRQKEELEKKERILIERFIYIRRPTISFLKKELEELYKKMKFNKEHNVRCAIYACTILSDEFALLVTPYVPTGGDKTGHRLSLGKGIVGKCLRGGEARIYNVDANRDFEIQMVEEWGFSKEEVNAITKDRKSYLCVPLRSGPRLLGAIYFDSSRQRIFDERTKDLVITLSSDITRRLEDLVMT